jgi:threonine synthase
MNNYTVVSPVARYLPVDGQWWLCPESQLALDVEYKTNELLLPLTQPPALTLGEGNTPLLKLERLSQMFGIELWAKCEFLNPTGSFKDRGSVVEIAKALELGKKGVVCASTGNMAASLSAYAAKAGLRCRVVVPASTPESKLQQALVCGSTLEKVAGNYDVCVSVAEKIAVREDYFLCGDYVIRREGQKSIGWELAKCGVDFDAVVVPVGNGTVGVAVMKGMAEKSRGRKNSKFIGIQANGANPIEVAWKNNTVIEPQQNTQTVASAFNVGNPLDGYLVLNWLGRTDGLMLAVSDTEILEAQEFLAEDEGLFVETTAATTLAGVVKSKEEFEGQSVVLILTGSGLKERKYK